MEIVMRGYVTGEYRHCITARGATIAEVDADAERQRWALGIEYFNIVGLDNRRADFEAYAGSKPGFDDRAFRDGGGREQVEALSARPGWVERLAAKLGFGA